jgi:hypothetical protein
VKKFFEFMLKRSAPIVLEHKGGKAWNICDIYPPMKIRGRLQMKRFDKYVFICMDVSR